MYVLDQESARALELYRRRVAELSGVENFNAPFSVAPVPHQKMVEAYQKTTEFLSKVNFVLVKEAHGQKLGLSGTAPIASTTDTRIMPRRPIGIGEVEGLDEYLCTKTNYDVAYLWSQIDLWAGLGDFQQRLSALAVKRIAQDKQRIGFHGTHRASTSNRQLYPNLQDVNMGWLEKIRQNSPERHINGLSLGAGQEFKNLDALVEMAKHELINEEHRDGTDLVVITSSSLVTDKALGLINQLHTPTEQVAANALYARKLLGTLPVDLPSFFPKDTLLITSYDNLSIYQQKGSVRRHLKDEPEWDRTSDYQSVNECFVVEDYSKVALIENIRVE
ncbi:MAG: P2 family phage major capsid protein [Moraxella sp.]|nr:P2 family phage major capsid protein [Moraxella sp.]